MKYIGNYFEWMNPSWINLLDSSKGQPRPQEWPLINSLEEDYYKDFEKIGYKTNQTLWTVYEKYDIQLEITPPWTNGLVHWWFVKMSPGQFMPIHSDPHTHDQECNRYWMPLQDYSTGHVFIINDKLITDYRAGDVFKFDDAQDIHGAANIGFNPRYTFLVTEYL